MQALTDPRYQFDGVDPALIPGWHPDSLRYSEPDLPTHTAPEPKGNTPMKFPVNGGGDFKRAPAGSHLAVCNMVVDLGLQPGSRMYPAPKHKVYIRFEIPAERIEYEKDGHKAEGPLTIGSFYTASMNEKAQLRKHLESWRGRGFTDEQAADFDVATILGKPCMLSVVENDEGGKTYSNIANISAIPKGIEAPKAENKLIYYGPDNDQAYYTDLPEWLVKKIDGQLKPAAAKAQAASAPMAEDEIPF